MSILPDHGDAFWDMFPKDANGNTIIKEINLDEYSNLEPDPDIVAQIEAINKENAA